MCSYASVCIVCKRGRPRGLLVSQLLVYHSEAKPVHPVWSHLRCQLSVYYGMFEMMNMPRSQDLKQVCYQIHCSIVGQTRLHGAGHKLRTCLLSSHYRAMHYQKLESAVTFGTRSMCGINDGAIDPWLLVITHTFSCETNANSTTSSISEPSKYSSHHIPYSQ